MSLKRWLIAGLLVFANLFLAMFTLAQSDPLPLPPSDADEYVLTEGDIMLPRSVIEGRATYDATLWTNKIVPYVFHASVNSTNRNRTIAAMNEWSSVSGLTFVERTSQYNYIEIINSGSVQGQPTGNWSYIGMVSFFGGRQYLSIYNWDYHYIIMHELAHALGYWHEQSRPDRDNYVTIQWANIQGGTSNDNFDINPDASTVGVYDFASIMHYDQYAFSTNGQRTIVAKPAYAGSQNLMGNLDYLTESDAAGMALLYPVGGGGGGGGGGSDEDGDTIETALVVDSSNYIYTGDSNPFTETGTDPLPTRCVGSNAVTDTIWFKIPAGSIERSAYLAASGYDTVMSVYSSFSSVLTFEGCVDLYGSTGSEIIDLPLKPNTDYYVQVGGWAGSAGTLSFSAYLDLTLISNGSLDWGGSWGVKSVPNTRPDDKIKSGYSGMTQSWGWMHFKGGAGENSTLKQIRTAAASNGVFNSGGSFLYGGYIQTKAAKSNTILKLTVKYANGTKTMSKHVSGGSTQNNWTWRAGVLTLTRSDVTQVILVMTNKSLGGVTKVDNLVVLPYNLAREALRGQQLAPEKQTISAAQLRTLPAAPDGFRGGN